jgi:glycosyltransferase involved in cell wall biosynthesis
MTAPVLLDITSLAAAPVRSGIQRVEREVLRHWPDPERLIPISLDRSGLIRQLPNAVRDILLPAADAVPRSVEQDQHALARLLAASPPLPRERSRHILNLELFFDAWRADAYERMCKEGWRVQWLIYDFMPWLHPELFPQGTSVHCMQYLRALRQVPEVAFISNQTRSEYQERAMRRHGRAGPVLPLGADGLGLERQHWSPSRRDLVMIGTIEGRKNIDLVMAAFRLLWADGVDATLVLIGRVAPDDRARIRAFAAEAGPRLKLLDHASDGELRDALRKARAVLYASSVEGFGLPPYEALHVGIPAIAAGIPSMESMPPHGHIRLERVTRETLVDALRMMMDDDTAARLWRETAAIQLPSWREFGRAIADWATGAPGRGSLA